MSPDGPPGSSEPGQREKNKAANRTAILAAARHVFGTVGYDASNIRDIVRESGLSPGTFYNYFPDKDAVFQALVGELLAELRPLLHDARSRATSVDAFVRDAFHVVLSVLAKDDARLAMLVQSTAAFRTHLFGTGPLEGLVKDLEEDMDRAMARGLLPHFSSSMMTAAMVGAAVEVCVRHAKPGEDLVPLADFLASVFIGGIERAAKPRTEPTRTAPSRTKPSRRGG